MKKTIVTLSMASIAMVSVIGLSSFTRSKVIPTTSEVHVNGYGDGHCTKCGTSNGYYNCKKFVQTIILPSVLVVIQRLHMLISNL